MESFISPRVWVICSVGENGFRFPSCHQRHIAFWLEVRLGIHFPISCACQSCEFVCTSVLLCLKILFVWSLPPPLALVVSLLPFSQIPKPVGVGADEDTYLI